MREYLLGRAEGILYLSGGMRQRNERRFKLRRCENKSALEHFVEKACVALRVRTQRFLIIVNRARMKKEPQHAPALACLYGNALTQADPGHSFHQLP